MDKVLFDVFLEHQKLKKEYFDANKNLKNMLLECTELINECKVDRE